MKPIVGKKIRNKKIELLLKKQRVKLDGSINQRNKELLWNTLIVISKCLGLIYLIQSFQLKLDLVEKRRNQKEKDSN